MVKKSFLIIKQAQESLSNADFLKAYRKLEEVEDFVKTNEGNIMKVDENFFMPIHLESYDLKEDKFYIYSKYFFTMENAMRYLDNSLYRPREIVINYDNIKNAELVMNRKDQFGLGYFSFNDAKNIRFDDLYFIDPKSGDIYKGDAKEVNSFYSNPLNKDGVELENVRTGEKIIADQQFVKFQLQSIDIKAAKKYLMNFNQITPNIYVGSEFFPYEIDKIVELGITAILALENRVYDIRKELEPYGIDYKEVFIPDFSVPEPAIMEGKKQ